MVIEELGGRRWIEPVERAEAEEAVQMVVDAHRRFEAARVAGTLAEEARPDPETCGRCPNRPVCQPYWDALTLSWDHGSVAGRLRGSSPGRLDLMVERPCDAAGETWVISGVPAIAPTEELTLVGAQRSASVRHLRWVWWTRTWPPARGSPAPLEGAGLTPVEDAQGTDAGDVGGGSSGSLVLPDVHRRPSLGGEGVVEVPVASHVGPQLGDPIGGVGDGDDAVLGAAVPEAAVDEDGHLGPGEGDVEADQPSPGNP